jgi:Fe2+ or Zn2+ uptake regulation protein
MRQSEKERRLEAYRRVCRDRGLSFTPQRRAILEAILDLDDHPTADLVHAALAGRRPRVSRATVFRTLEAFARDGIITKACHPGSAVRYDWRTETHHHLICLRCDAVTDISDARLDALPVPDTRRFGFVIRDFRVQLRGICRRCRELEDRK